MSSILVSELNDLQFIINDDIYLSGSSDGINEEIYNNFWQISFNEKFISKISVIELNNFLSQLLKKRLEQITEISNISVATFYLWFDEQSSQLCFNLLSGQDIELPFGCTICIVDSADIILDQCVKSAQYPAIKIDQIKFLEPGDVGLNDDENHKKYVLNVWVTTLHSKTGKIL